MLARDGLYRVAPPTHPRPPCCRGDEAGQGAPMTPGRAIRTYDRAGHTACSATCHGERPAATRYASRVAALASSCAQHTTVGLASSLRATPHMGATSPRAPPFCPHLAGPARQLAPSCRRRGRRVLLQRQDEAVDLRAPRAPASRLGHSAGQEDWARLLLQQEDQGGDLDLAAQRRRDAQPWGRFGALRGPRI